MLRRILKPLSNDKEFINPASEVTPLGVFFYLIREVIRYY